MNKLFTASAATLLLTSGAVMAANDVTFLGSVSDITCDIQAVVVGHVNSMIQLGTVAKSTKGTVVNFSLEPKDMTTCKAALNGATHTATVTWAGCPLPLKWNNYN